MEQRRLPVGGPWGAPGEDRDRWELTPLEIAAGVPIGLEDGPALPATGGAVDPVAALDAAVVPALSRPPCVVSFSGGRDSSAVLAVAARVARREGLPPPVPVTLRFPGAPEADESEWQASVVDHLGLDDWVRVDVDDELDLVGPVAAGLLRRHGLMWPPNAHFHVPILDHAKGGSVLTGIDGDGLLASWRWARVAAVLGRRARPRPRDVLRVGLALAPRPLREASDRRRMVADMAWLTPHAAGLLARAWALTGATEPWRWDERVRWWARLRSLRFVVRTFTLMADDAGVRAVHPLTDPAFLAALARAGGRWGLGDRTAVMRRLFTSLLPDEVLVRPTKASLDRPFWNRHSRAFVASWDGRGVDPALVDPAALRATWSAPAPHAGSSTLLQAAWLSRDGGGTSGRQHGEEPLDGDR